MHIVIPDDYQDVVRTLRCFDALRDHRVTIFNDTTKDLGELVRRFSDADALVLIRERTAITRELLQCLPRLRTISQTGKGTAHIDLDACREHGVEVLVGTGSPYAPAELTIALMLAAMRRIPQEAASLRSGGWQRGLGSTVRGRILGIYGFGKIGALVASYGSALGMRVLAFGREGSRERALQHGYEFARSSEELFERSDVLSLHLRLTAETRGIVTSQQLALMKPTSLLVNSSRAELIAENALVEALRQGRPGGAAVDVFEEEPVLGASHPLLAFDNVIATPHLGYVERDGYEMYFGEAFANLLQKEAGRA